MNLVNHSLSVILYYLELPPTQSQATVTRVSHKPIDDTDIEYSTSSEEQSIMIQPKESTTAKQRTIIEEEESSKRESDNKENELEKPENQVEESESEELSFLFDYEVCLVNF